MLVRRRTTRDERSHAPSAGAVVKAALALKPDPADALAPSDLRTLVALVENVPRRPFAIDMNAALPGDGKQKPDRTCLDALYNSTAQCADDGLRFANQHDLAKHMDIVFQRNRELRDRNLGTSSRSWAPSRDAFATTASVSNGNWCEALW